MRYHLTPPPFLPLSHCTCSQVYKDPNGLDCLTISSASRSMAGEYEVKATNDMGTASCKCNVKVNSE